MMAQRSQDYPTTNPLSATLNIIGRVRKVLGLWLGNCHSEGPPESAQSVVSGLVTITKSKPPYSKWEQDFDWRHFITAPTCSGTGKGPGAVEHYTEMGLLLENFRYIASGTVKWNTLCLHCPNTKYSLKKFLGTLRRYTHRRKKHKCLPIWVILLH